MEPLWLDEVFGFKVERRPIPRPGNRPLIPLDPTGIGIQHTTEGKTVDSALAQFAMRNDPPTVCIGENRIVQCRPIGTQAAALHDPANRVAFIQIEAVAFSQQKLWLPDDATLKPLVAFIAYCAQQGWVELARPSADWKDNCSDMPLPWAANNARRQSEIFPNAKGWFGHIDVTNQGPTWHWDPGCLNYTEIFAQAQALIDSSQPAQTVAEHLAADTTGGVEGEITQL